MKYISIFCGSSLGMDHIFRDQAVYSGRVIAQRGYNIVYGGAHVGLMGAIADAVLDSGGEVIGVIPDFLREKELHHEGVTELHVVKTMHERKFKMDELSDAVIALPGGFGTMEELFEMLTWAQLSLHQKPIGLLNTDGFYDPLSYLFEKMIEKGFLKKAYHDLLLVDKDINKLLDKMENYVPLDKNKNSII